MMKPMVVSRRALLAVPFLAALALLALPSPGRAGTKAKAPPRYYVQLTTVALADGVIADEALVVAAVRAKAEAALAASAQFVIAVEGAPADSATPAVWKAWLTKQRLAGAMKLNVVITTASEETTPDPAKKGQRFRTDLGITLFGEHMPARGMAFSGDGAATVKVELGMKLRDADRRYAWEESATEAVNKAITASLAKLTEKAK